MRFISSEHSHSPNIYNSIVKLLGPYKWALTLIATGTLTVEMARAARGRTITLPRTLNFSTGKDSMC
jgi:hypothetical protein